MQGKSEIEVRDAAKLFDEIQCVVESKQLAPVLHTQVRLLTLGLACQLRVLTIARSEVPAHLRTPEPRARCASRRNGRPLRRLSTRL